MMRIGSSANGSAAPKCRPPLLQEGLDAFAAFGAVAVLYAVVQLQFPGHNGTATAVVVGSILLLILRLYRIVPYEDLLGF